MRKQTTSCNSGLGNETTANMEYEWMLDVWDENSIPLDYFVPKECLSMIFVCSLCL